MAFIGFLLTEKTKNYPLLCDFETAIRIPGYYPAQYHFCVHPSNSAAYIYYTGTFIIIDLNGINGNVEIKCPPLSTSKWDSIRGIHCIEYESKTFLLVLATKAITNSCLLVLYELNIEERIAVVKIEHYVPLKDDTLLKSKWLINDENGCLYYVASLDDAVNRKYTFSVIKIIIDDTLKVSHDVLIDNQIVLLSCFYHPFIYKRCIGFFVNVDQGSFRQVVLINLENETKLEQYRVIAPDTMIPKTNSQFPTCEFFCPPGFQSSASGLLYSYVFINEKRKGELWALNFDSKKWKKCFEIVSHVIGKISQLILRQDGRLFLYGNCTDEGCNEKAHVYHFGVSVLGEKYFPTIDQLSALLSKSKTQFYVGPRGSGKSLMLLLKSINAFQSVADGDKIKIFVSSNEQRNDFCNKLSSIFGKSLKSNVLLLSENNYEEEQFDDCDIFVDGLSTSSFSFKQKCFFIERLKRTVVTLDKDSILQYGFDHPRAENVSWHRFNSMMKDSDSHDGYGIKLAFKRIYGRFLTWHFYDRLKTIKLWISETISAIKNRIFSTYNIPEPGKAKDKNEMEVYMEEWLESLKYFYGSEWWSASFEKETVCIPACLDVYKNKCSIPTESIAKGYDHDTFSLKEHLYRGQKAENDFLIALQKLKIGGVLVSGFDPIEFKKANKGFSRNLRYWTIKRFEADCIFIHPSIGIFIFEVKSTSDEKILGDKLKEAEAQLNRIKEQLPIVFKKICKAQCSVNLYFAISFPNADMSKYKKESNYLPIFDISDIQDTQELKNHILSKMSGTLYDEKDLEHLKMFTAAIAGYRSMSFLSVGHNALAVQKKIDKIGKEKEKNQNQNLQSPPGKEPDLREGEHGIFLTNYQFAIVECQAQQQIISGPPGTGKTLIIMAKALAASMTKQNGNIHIIAPRPELLFKFQKIFELHRKYVVRLPSYHRGLGSYADNDDIFADEISLKDYQTERLLERQKQSGYGKTIIGITGFFNPLEVQNVKEFLLKQNLTGFTHFSTNTVFRSSQEIFNKWNHEFNSDSFLLCLGHSIFGPSVREEKLRNSVEILDRIKETIHELFEISTNSSITEKISLKNLCIITDYVETCSLIKSFLASHHIPCGSIEEQNIEHSITAVSTFDATISYEWPVVIVVSMIDTAFRHKFSLLAISRCIAKLIIIERDFGYVTKEIDNSTEQLRFSPEPSMLTFSSFRDVVVNAEKEIGETNNFVINHYITFQIIRWNICFAELKTLKFFEKCNSLFECWQIFADDLIVCRSFFQELEDADRFRGILKGNIIMDCVPKKPSSFFVRLTEHLTEEDRKKAWKTLKQIESSLYEIVINENNDTNHRNETDMGKVKDVLDEINENMAGDAWKFFCYTFRYLMH